MFHHEISSSLSCLGCLSLIALCAGCGGDTVNLGGGKLGQSTPRGASCVDSPVVPSSIHAQSQQDLEDLAGCEEINGDLQVDIFAGADLSPLSALKVIDGALELGLSPALRFLPDGTIDPAQFGPGYQPVADVLKSGYLDSLTGLESLERVRSLNLNSITASDLEPLLGLRQLDANGAGSSFAGSVNIQSAPHLRDLHGLSNIAVIRDLTLSENPALLSLGGISLDTSVDGRIMLTDSPLLGSLDVTHNGLVSAGALVLDNIGFSDLSSLIGGLGGGLALGDVVISRNAHLLDMEGLTAFEARSLVIVDNPVLRSIPAMAVMSSLESFTANRNPQLQSIDIDLPARSQGNSPANVDHLSDPIQLVDIEGNDQLTHIALAQGLDEGLILDVYQNKSLIDVDLGTLTRLQELHLDSNPNLTSVALGALKTVETLSVVNNWSLDTTGLRSLQTFQSTLENNAYGSPTAP